MRLAVLAAADSIHSRRWVDYLAGRGHEVHWFSLAPFSGDPPAGVTCHEVDPYFTASYDGSDQDTTATLAHPRGLIALWRGGRRVRRICRERNVELLHVHSVGAYGLVAALSRFHPLVATAWGSDVLISAKSPVKRPLIKHVLNSADALTCDAYHMEKAMAQLGADPAKIRVIFFGTDTNKFRPGLDRAAMRTKHGLGAQPVILSTRSLLPVYDIPTLIRAMPEVFRASPDARCVIVGRGSERERLEALAREQGVSDRIIFTGPCTGEEMPLYLAAADIYVSTSTSDAGLAASTAEAMAVGLPAVVSDSAENRLWVEDAKGGYIFPVGDSKALAEKLIHLLQHPELRSAMGAHNRPVIDQRNNFRVEMGKIEALYQSLIADRKRGAR